MGRPGRLRGGRSLGILVLIGVGACGLSACGGGTAAGQSLAQQACVHVTRSVRDFEQSTVTGTPAATVASLQNKAAEELRVALPLAAQANSDDGSWNSLMTTISEGANVDEAHLLPALKAQCVVANNNPDVNPQNVNPIPAGSSGTSQNPAG